MSYERRRRALEARLRELGRLAVGVSGGVDSAVLLHAAHAMLGAGAIGVIADSPSLARSDLSDARALCNAIGARLVVVRTEELGDPDYRANRGDRCYFCKRALFVAMREVARSEALEHLAFGAITDDQSDDRPGARAADELGVVAPLQDAGFSKRDVRRYAREAGIAVADKPAAACLASRIPVGTEVTRVRLAEVERAEVALRALGLVELRVRHRGTHARVEVGNGERARAEALGDSIRDALQVAAGFESAELATYLPPAQR